MKRFVNDIKKYYKFTIYSAKSELKSEIANSHLSWLWWILDPLLFMMVYSFISIIVFSKSEPYFPVFVFIGLASWQFFEKTVKVSVKLVSNNRSIVSKVYLPKYILILQKMGVQGFKMMISYILVVIMMVGYRIHVGPVILYIIPIFLTLFVITFGFSTILMHFGVFVEDLFNVVNVLLRLVFYLSGIFYNIVKRVPEPYNEVLLKVNPVALIMTDLRSVMIYETMPHRKWILLWFVIGVLLSVIGVKTIYKYENSYVKVI
jgi:ABC-type polysaccharide/polyol phosphate export permease